MAWTHVLQMQRDHRYQFKLLYPGKLPITIDGGNKTFHDKTKLSNIFLQTQLYRRGQRANQNLRRLIIPSKGQEIIKRGSHTDHHHHHISNKVMGINKNRSFISLTTSDLKFQTKRHRLTEWMQNQNPSCCIQETHLNIKDRYHLRLKGWEKLFPGNRPKNQTCVAIFKI